MIFGDALEFLKAGRIMRRKKWAAGDYITCHYTADMRPFLMASIGGNEPIPYIAGNTDLFAEDWEVKDECSL